MVSVVHCAVTFRLTPGGAAGPEGLVAAFQKVHFGVGKGWVVVDVEVSVPPSQVSVESRPPLGRKLAVEYQHHLLLRSLTNKTLNYFVFGVNVDGPLGSECVCDLYKCTLHY